MSAGCHAIIHAKHVAAQDVSLGSCPGELEILTVNFLATTPHDKERWLTKLGNLIATRGPAARGAQSAAAVVMSGMPATADPEAPDTEDDAPPRPPVSTDAIAAEAATPATPPRESAPPPVESQLSAASLTASSISDV